jgi:hypothetical protein
MSRWANEEGFYVSRVVYIYQRRAGDQQMSKLRDETVGSGDWKKLCKMEVKECEWKGALIFGPRFVEVSACGLAWWLGGSDWSPPRVCNIKGLKGFDRTGKCIKSCRAGLMKESDLRARTWDLLSSSYPH